MEQNENSGVNTILIVLLIAIVVGGLVWFMRGAPASTPESDTGFEIDVNLPEGDSGGEGDGGQ